MSVVIQQLPKGDLVRFREIDRSEEATLHYRQIGTRLVSEPVKDSIPNFFEEGPHSVAELVARWQPVVEEGGILLGAFADGDLVGIALLGGEVAPRVRQLALLFVSRAHRRRGVAGSLTDAMEELARASAAVARGGRVGDEMDEVTPLPLAGLRKELLRDAAVGVVEVLHNVGYDAWTLRREAAHDWSLLGHVAVYPEVGTPACMPTLVSQSWRRAHGRKHHCRADPDNKKTDSRAPLRPAH